LDEPDVFALEFSAGTRGVCAIGHPPSVKAASAPAVRDSQKAGRDHDLSIEIYLHGVGDAERTFVLETGRDDP
jgi:hypothetical protein